VDEGAATTGAQPNGQRRRRISVLGRFDHLVPALVTRRTGHGAFCSGREFGFSGEGFAAAARAVAGAVARAGRRHAPFVSEMGKGHSF